jgi:hypothetical protein
MKEKAGDIGEHRVTIVPTGRPICISTLDHGRAPDQGFVSILAVSAIKISVALLWLSSSRRIHAVPPAQKLALVLPQAMYRCPQETW